VFSEKKTYDFYVTWANTHTEFENFSTFGFLAHLRCKELPPRIKCIITTVYVVLKN